jgi:hypothetical protein
MVNRRMRNGKQGKNVVTNVRVLDPSAGTDGAYVDRCITELQNSHSQVTILCQDSFNVDSATTTVVGNLSASQVRIFDEFTTLATQFETYRIRGFRFDIYDINPTLATVGWFSTFHDEFLASNQPVFSSAAVIDGPDSALVPPGLGKISLYWRARGSQENDFQTTDSNSITLQAFDFGGLRYALGASAAGRKFQIIVKALVDFRGRF